jgi:hypothetical protein
MAKKKPKQNKTRKGTSGDECIIPPELPKGELHKLLCRYSENESLAIKDESLTV